MFVCCCFLFILMFSLATSRALDDFKTQLKAKFSPLVKADVFWKQAIQLEEAAVQNTIACGSVGSESAGKSSNLCDVSYCETVRERAREAGLELAEQQGKLVREDATQAMEQVIITSLHYETRYSQIYIYIYTLHAKTHVG